MLIAQIDNANIGRIDHYRKLFPYTVFEDTGPTDEWLQQNSCKKVNSFKEHDQETELLESCDPYVEGDWVYVVRVRSKTQEEIQIDLSVKAARVRAQRNQLLKDSDWTQGRDIPDATATAWAIYRQALRDLPQQEGFPTDITWPQQPE